jgi:hypothetical protein
MLWISKIFGSQKGDMGLYGVQKGNLELFYVSYTGAGFTLSKVPGLHRCIADILLLNRVAAANFV